MKECTLAVVEPPLMRKSRYRPTDKLLKFLESLQRRRSFASSIGKRHSRLPFPITYFSQIVAVFLNIFPMLDKLAHKYRLQLNAIVTRLRQAMNGVHHEVEAIQFVKNSHVERGSDRALFFVAADVNPVKPVAADTL